MKNTDAVIYEIKYITIQIINNQNIDKEVPLCLSFSDVDAYSTFYAYIHYITFTMMHNFALTENNK